MGDGIYQLGVRIQQQRYMDGCGVREGKGGASFQQTQHFFWPEFPRWPVLTVVLARFLPSSPDFKVLYN